MAMTKQAAAEAYNIGSNIAVKEAGVDGSLIDPENPYESGVKIAMAEAGLLRREKVANPILNRALMGGALGAGAGGLVGGDLESALMGAGAGGLGGALAGGAHKALARKLIGSVENPGVIGGAESLGSRIGKTLSGGKARGAYNRMREGAQKALDETGGIAAARAGEGSVMSQYRDVSPQALEAALANLQRRMGGMNIAEAAAARKGLANAGLGLGALGAGGLGAGAVFGED